MPYATCPACDESTYVSAKLREGDLVRCRHCGEELEVVDTDPFELDWPYYDDDEADEDEEEDEWEEEEEEEEENDW
jgi:NAD-dependent SIR2 family protein deacetylase